MTMRKTLKPLIGISLVLAAGALNAAAGQAGGQAVFRTAAAANANPFVAGKTAAEALKAALRGVEPQVVLLAECFEDKEDKDKVLEGVATVFKREKLCGGATYGAYTQAGALQRDAVALLAIGGDAVRVRTALVEKMGAAGLSLEKDQERLTAALQGAGARLAKQLPDAAKASLMIVIADAHSPKNQLLLDGIQSVVGRKLPVTGGSVNKNAGQNWVYYQGKAYSDSAVALVLTGGLKVAQAGRQAKDNDAVISTARESAATALSKLGKAPDVIVAFDCAGRMGKLKNVTDELAAIQDSVGREVPLFGLYCAGEFGPADISDAPDPTVCYGRGWHVMMSALGQ
jgi:hypothetical protein